MLSLLDDMIRRHRGSDILVDANLLVVFLLGSYDRNAVAEFKRTRAYSADDFDLLRGILGKFERLIVTPSVLAEVSNLAGQLPQHMRSAFFAYFAAILPRTDAYVERLVDLPQVAQSRCFLRLGFTDATVYELGASGYPVLTDDLDLYLQLRASEIEAFNFTQVRLLRP